VILVEDLAKLWRLQELELEAARWRRELEQEDQSDGIRQKAEIVLQFEERLRELDNRLASQRKSLKKWEQQLKEKNAQAMELQQQLYGGTVNNPKELESLQQKHIDLMREIAGAEDDYLDVVESLDEAEASKKELEQDVNELRTTQKELSSQFAAWREEIETRLALLEHECRQEEQDIDLELLTTYRKLASQKAGIGVARLNNQTCGACHMEVPLFMAKEVIRGKRLVFCESCGRILYGG